MERRNQLQQLRKLKREEATERKRSLGGFGAPPFLTAVVSVSATEDPLKFLEVLKGCDDSAIVTHSSQGYCHISLPRFKKRYSFVLPQQGDIYSILDATKVADTVVLLYSLDSGFDDVGDTILSVLFAQGLPSPIHVIQGLEAIAVKQRSEAKKQITKILESRFPGDKIHSVDKKEDAILLLRQIANQKRRPVSYRDARPHLLAESLEFCHRDDQNLLGTLKVSGYLRGQQLSVNSLVHIPGHGDFQMVQIDAPDDPHPLVLKTRDSSNSVEMAEQSPKVLEKADPLKQESLQSENIPDSMDAEQTWPTAEELAEAEGMAVCLRFLVKFREERMDQMFPDEVDTPLDGPARTRFARYRGLKSFHSSPWDPKENLPFDYARVFQFENFSRTKKRVMAEERDGAMPGWYITLHLANVPRSVYEAFRKRGGEPLVLFGLLPYEQKMSVLHVAVKRHLGFTEPIKSKERLVFHVGYRRFAACPIFSAHTNGDKHKYERFQRSDTVSVATMFAPIIFPPVSAVVFKEAPGGEHQLVGSGAVLGANPDRVVVKRAVLSGHPFKINRKSAVVRYMFFNRDDILWFKPVELKTKYGRRGHIKEPLGTHGHMKCVFNGQLKSQDTVLMHLYKRVFPKWTYDPDVPRPEPHYQSHETAGSKACELME
ncbi:ribosome biogenesis protein tsr1, putative [Ixodes scapularis]|uniref:Pre-rRNA-processing protein TSR1 homolog n=1 Tax=Ixodes scapularis TaxID=6945 RepID=B7Q452_IXOSC|nr:ribosome biogenesis protein tsr1, putative [Ixodes scapularis]|eukprot:XP_002411476.1 ribosome biogenesis protein tsr1, putative [Ixodes scapularis]